MPSNGSCSGARATSFLRCHPKDPGFSMRDVETAKPARPAEPQRSAPPWLPSFRWCARLALWLFAPLVLYEGCTAITTRGVTLEIAGDPTIHFTYRARWGWSMSERVSIAQSAWPLTGAAVEQAIWKRPYWSGAQLYRTIDNQFYDFKLGKRSTGTLYRYDPRKATIAPLDLCAFDRHRGDAGASSRHVPGRHDDQNAGSIYFPGRVFVGSFAIEGRWGGESVVLTRAGQAAEPPLIDGECP